MKDRLFVAIRKPIDAVTDDAVRSFKRAVEEIQKLERVESKPYFFESGGNVEMDGKFKVTKEGEFVFAGGVSGSGVVEGVPLTAKIESEFAKEWDVRNSGKLVVGFYVRFELGQQTVRSN